MSPEGPWRDTVGASLPEQDTQSRCRLVRCRNLSAFVGCCAGSPSEARPPGSCLSPHLSPIGPML